MLRSILIRLAALFTLGELTRWTADILAGNPDAPAEHSEDSIKTVTDLREELGTDFPESLYGIFGQAVDHHLKEQYPEALAEYKKLRSLERSGEEPFDLLDSSKVFQHNWKLLSKDIQP